MSLHITSGVGLRVGVVGAHETVDPEGEDIPLGRTEALTRGGGGGTVICGCRSGGAQSGTVGSDCRATHGVACPSESVEACLRSHVGTPSP